MTVLSAAATTVVNSHRLTPPPRNERGKVNLLQVKTVRFESVHKQITQRLSSLLIRHSASTTRCAAAEATQAQTITRKAPTITHMPTKGTLPVVDNGGTGFPPRDDGGGGGGGGGGGKWSGGFFLFGFLAFLSFLKDKESEGSYDKSRRR